MTFRAKLQQAILGVVAGTTVAVLWVAQTQNSVSYRRMVDTLFRQQMEIFRREQDSQLQLAKQQATRLADSVRLFAALEEGDPETYKVAVDELRLAEFDFFRLASTQTGLMPPPEGTRTGHFSPDVETSLETQLNQAAKAIPEDEPNSQVGFVSLSSEDGSQQFYRVLAMQIRNFDQTVGTLFLGQSVRRFIPKVEDANAPQMQTAFWTQEGLLSEGIPLLTKTEMTRQLATIGTQAQLDFSFQVAGVDHYAHLHLLNPKSHFQPTWLVSIFSLADLQTQQQELRLRVIAIGLIALCLASVVAWFFAAQLAKPIRELVKATNEVRAGNFQVRLTRGRTNEFAALTESFNDMTEGLALKERYHSVLSMVADARVAEQLMAGNIQLGGELRQVTVIFCDIRGYTALSAGRDPREVIALLNAHMGALTRVVYRWHGVINQFAGDALMILFGAPASHGDDAQNAVNCALEMISERDRLNADSQEPLGIGIGIATGTVVAGCIGAENRADYTVVGEHVNLAARLCSSAVAGEIIADAATQALLPATFQTQPLHPLKLKGFAEPVAAFRVISTTAV
ncbi:MAG: HAMP domain-containing protein [Prosthecobacter sp.]|nr:HAMP domain-containing protein [Prosthecobacter sp.]